MVQFAVLWGSTSVWPPQQLSAQLLNCSHHLSRSTKMSPVWSLSVFKLSLSTNSHCHCCSLENDSRETNRGTIKYNIREIKRECQFIADKLWLTNKQLLFVLYCNTNWLWSLKRWVITNIFWVFVLQIYFLSPNRVLSKGVRCLPLTAEGPLAPSFQQLYKWRCPLLLRQTEESPRPTLLTSRHLYSSSAADGRSTFADPPSPSLLPRLICWVMHCLAHTPPILRKATILRHKSSGELTDKKYKVAERVRVGSRARVARSRSQGSTRERSRGATLSIIFSTQ